MVSNIVFYDTHIFYRRKGERYGAVPIKEYGKCECGAAFALSERVMLLVLYRRGGVEDESLRLSKTSRFDVDNIAPFNYKIKPVMLQNG